MGHFMKIIIRLS